jgi:hypothetical protein
MSLKRLTEQQRQAPLQLLSRGGHQGRDHQTMSVPAPAPAPATEPVSVFEKREH